MLERVKSKTSLVFVLFVIGLVSAPIWNGLTLLAAVLLIGSVTLFRLGILARLAIALLVCGALGAMAMQVTTLAGVAMNFTILYILLLASAFAYAFALRDRITVRTSVSDIIACLVGVIVFVVLAMPLFGASSSKVLESLIPGEDNSSHLQMYRYVLVEKQYAFENNPEQAGIRPSLLSYAQGSHAAMATVTAPFVEHGSRDAQLGAYVYTAAATYAMIFWLIFLVIVRPLGVIKDMRLRVAMTGLVSTLYVIGVPFSVFMGLYTYGYYPQNLSYVGLALMLLAMTSLAESRNEKSSVSSVLIEAGLLLIGLYIVFASWYLLTFVALPIVLGYAWVNRRALWQYRLPLLGLLVPMAALCGCLAYVYLFQSSGAGHVLTPGGVVRMRVRLLAVALPALVLGFMMWRKRQWYLLAFTLSLVAAAAMSVLIGAYQIKKIQHLDYYFYKSLFTVLLIAVAYYGYLFSRSLGNALASVRPSVLRGQSIIMPAVGLIAIAVSLFSFSMPKYLDNFIDTRYDLPQSAANRILDPLTNQSLYEVYSDVIFLNNCNPYTNFTGTIWSGSFFLPYNPLRHQIENDLMAETPEKINQPNSEILADIAEYASKKSRPVALVVGAECIEKQRAAEAMTGRNVRLITPAGVAIN